MKKFMVVILGLGVLFFVIYFALIVSFFNVLSQL